MRSPNTPSGPEERLLADLAREVCVGPSSAAQDRHIASAAAQARSNRSAHNRELTRFGAIALALTTLVGTSGVAVAGNLPRGVQGVVADAAKLLPVPLPIPYPAAPAITIPPDPVLDELDQVVTEEPDSTPATPPVDEVPSRDGDEASPERLDRSTDDRPDDEWRDGDRDSERDGRDRASGDDDERDRRDHDRDWDDEDDHRDDDRDRDDHDRDDDDRDENGSEGSDEEFENWGDRDQGRDHEERNPSNDWRRDDDRS